MVDRESSRPHDQGDEPLFNAPLTSDFERRFARIEQLSRVFSILGLSIGLDEDLDRGAGVSKRFVTRTTGSETYPFPHTRVKMRPKNKRNSAIAVAALRYPAADLTDVHSAFGGDHVYIAWEMESGQESPHVLDVDAFSRLDLAEAFTSVNTEGRWPATHSRADTDEIEQFHLEEILRDFEPDLQTTDTEVTA